MLRARSQLIARSLQTYTTISVFLMMMANHPDVLHKAQSEVDAVVGDRLPTLQDRDSLPYVHAVISEVMRWHVALPLSK